MIETAINTFLILGAAAVAALIVGGGILLSAAPADWLWRRRG